MTNSPLRFRRKLVALAAALVGGGAFAQAEEPANAVSIGAGMASGDRASRALFGQYNDLRGNSGTVQVGLQLNRRDEASDTTLRLTGTDLMGRNADLNLQWKKPGDWTLSASLARQIHEDPLAPGNGTELRLQRTALGLALRKALGPDLQVDVALSSEHKTGTRLFGIGMTCPSAVAPGCLGSSGIATGFALLMVPEAVDANHTQIEARIGYAGDRLRINAGYYGSFYRNAFDSLSATVPATLNNALGTPLPPSTGLAAILARPVALAPDNDSQQIDMAGTFAVTPTTIVNFKLARAQATQHQDFAAGGFTDAPTGVANLGGRVDTTTAQVGFSARPIATLSFLGRVNYEDRDDSTPIAVYNVEGASTYTNRRLPGTKLRGLLQANLQFTSDLRGTLAATYEGIDRGTFTATSAVAGITALRQKTDERGLRAELRQRVSEDLSGSITLATSRRGGSNWLRDNSGTGVTEVTNPNDPASGFASGIFMPTLADRQRDTLKLGADWQAGENLAFQVSAQAGHDSFSTPSAFGLRSSGMGQVELDASYAISERWNLVGNLSWGNQTLRQARPDVAVIDYDNRSSAFTLGFTGKPKSGFEVGASLAHSNDRSIYAQSLLPTADGASMALLAATGGLPDIVFRQTTLKAFGRWKSTKTSEWQIDLAHQRSTWSDWTWAYNGTPFRYSDGTTVAAPSHQTVSFIGMRFVHRWN